MPDSEKSVPRYTVHPSHSIEASLTSVGASCLACHATLGDAALAIECVPKIAGRKAEAQRKSIENLERARDAGEFLDKELEFLQRACVELRAFSDPAQRRLLTFLATRFGLATPGRMPEVPW